MLVIRTSELWVQTKLLTQSSSIWRMIVRILWRISDTRIGQDLAARVCNPIQDGCLSPQDPGLLQPYNLVKESKTETEAKRATVLIKGRCLFGTAVAPKCFLSWLTWNV